MPQVILSQNALSNLTKLYEFLKKSNIESAKNAVKTIHNAFLPLKNMPFLGRTIEENENLKELIIKFGNSGYVALYKYDKQSNNVIILAIKHQKELGY